MGGRRASHRHSNGCELVAVSVEGLPVAETVEVVLVGAAPKAAAIETVVVWEDSAGLDRLYLDAVHVVGVGMMAVLAGPDREVAAAECWDEESRAVADEWVPLGTCTQVNYC